MGGIADQVAQDREQQRRDAFGRYVELLDADSTEPAAVKELHDVMDILGKSANDVQNDAGTIRSAKTIRAKIDAAKGLATRREQAKAAIPAFADETDQIARDRAARLK